MITEAQLKIHNRCITGSKVAAILNISPFSSKYECFARMKGLLPPIEATERMKAGNYMEDGVAKYAEKEWGWKLADSPLICEKFHPEYDFLYGLPDRIRFEDGKFKHTNLEVIEIKTIDKYVKHEWGGEIKENYVGKFVPPDYYRTQLYFYMMLYDLPGRFAVCFGGNEFEEIPLERNPTIEKYILEACLIFWDDLEHNRWPDPGGSTSATETVKKLFPSSNLTTIGGDTNLLEILRDRESWRDTEKVACQKKEACENKLKAYMKDHQKLSFPGGNYCTWKQAKDTRYFDKDALMAEQPEIYKKYTKTKPGSRRFLPKLK